MLRVCARAYATRPPARFPDPLAKATSTALGDGLTFVHRPPPSAPSSASTTLDPASPLLRPATPAGTPLPPLLRPSAYRPEPARLSRADVDKLRALRASDPALYTCTKLAKMFSCAPSFVSQVAALPRQLRRARARTQQDTVAAVRAGWGERKTTLRAIRDKRRQFW